MKNFTINPINQGLSASLQHKIDFKTKPLGALGNLEKLALQIGTIQQTLTPELRKPAIIVFAGDHGIAREGVSAYPQEVTYQMVMNFLQDGAAINVFCKQNGIDLSVVDAGVNFDFPLSEKLINAKVGYGTNSFLSEPAMSFAQCEKALEKGAEICDTIFNDGCNIIGFGEMGIGNTSSAALIMHKICHIPLEDCIGRGTGLSDEQLDMKRRTLVKAAQIHSVKTPMDILMTYGGFEMAMMCGAMLQAAENGMIVLVDGFIATSVYLIAHAMFPEIVAYTIFCHRSDEHGHQRMLDYLGAKPLLDQGMRLGEGTGCALALPIIKSAVAFLNEMASFESAGVSTQA